MIPYHTYQYTGVMLGNNSQIPQIIPTSHQSIDHPLYHTSCSDDNEHIYDIHLRKCIMHQKFSTITLQLTKEWYLLKNKIHKATITLQVDERKLTLVQ